MLLPVRFQENVAHVWQRFSPPPRGWVGVDIGHRTIKFAQVELRRGQCQITRRWLMDFGLEHNDSSPTLETGLLNQKKSELVAIQKFFAESQCTAALSMSLTDLRSFEIPKGPRSEMREMVGQEFAAEQDGDVDHRTVDFWELGQGNGETSRVTAVATSSHVATRVVRDLTAAGLECRVLDGLPCALARAAAMADQDSAEAVGILDLGHSSPTLVIAAQGKPLFTRVLRGGGLQSLKQPLLESLNLSDEQCTQLLVRYGVAGNDSPVNSPARRIMQLSASALLVLVEEIERTLTFVAQQFQALYPSRIWLVGGGAAVCNLSDYLSEHIRLPVHVWKLAAATDEKSSNDALFAVAAALSTLKWEHQACM